MLFKQPFLASFFVIAAGINLCVASISDTQDDLIAWVETQKTISETKAEWASEKVIVEDLIELLKIEKEKYEASIEALSNTSDTTDKRRSELNEARDRLLAANEALESVIPGLEDQVRALVTKLPTPLVEELDQLIRRIPESGAETRMQVSQRLLTVVGILNRIDKFNTDITVTSEIRNTGSASFEVTTLYFGLAGAYFANDSGTFAGYGTPGTDGWEWTENAAIATDVVNLIKSYQGTREAKFVELPIKAL